MMSSQDIKSTNLNLVFMNGSTTTGKSPSKLLSRFGVVWICVEKSNEYSNTCTNKVLHKAFLYKAI